jgi:hypothetical protein
VDAAVAVELAAGFLVAKPAGDFGPAAPERSACSAADHSEPVERHAEPAVIGEGRHVDVELISVRSNHPL